MNKIFFIRLLYNQFFSKYLPGFIRKLMLKNNKIAFIPTKHKILPKNNYPIQNTYEIQEELIKKYKLTEKISFNSFPDLKKILKDKYDTETSFNFLDYGGEKIDLYLDISREFKNINYFLINQPKINSILQLIKEKNNYKNLNILNNNSEIENNKYDFVFFGSTLQYLDNYEEILSLILPLTNKYILFSATHFFTSDHFLKNLVVKQLNYLPKVYFFYFLNLDNITNILKKYNFKKEFDLLNESYPSSYSAFDHLKLDNIKYTDIFFSKNFN